MDAAWNFETNQTDAEADVIEKMLDGATVTKEVQNAVSKVVANESNIGDPLVSEAFEYLKESFRKHFHEAMLEAGRYLIEKFYDNDYEGARKGKRAKKKESLNQLVERLQANSSDAPSKTWIYDAVRLAVDDHYYNVEGGAFFRAYGKLGHSQKLRLAYVRQPEIKERLIDEIAKDEKPCTDRYLRRRIAEEKREFPKKERIPTIFQAIKDPKKIALPEVKNVRSFDYISNLETKDIETLLKGADEAVSKIKSEIEKREKEIQERKKEIKAYINDLNNYKILSRRIESVAIWQEELKKRETEGTIADVPEETPRLEKLRNAVEFMCFWKGFDYANLCVDTSWYRKNPYVPIEEADEDLLESMLRAGQCDLKPTYDFEVTKRGQVKWLSKKQVWNRIEKGTFWLTKEKYRLLNDPEYYDYK